MLDSSQMHKEAVHKTNRVTGTSAKVQKAAIKEVCFPLEKKV